MSGEAPRRHSAEIKSGGLCSSCGESAAEEGKAPGNFCQSCGVKLRKKTEMLPAQHRKVIIKEPDGVSKSVSSAVDPDPTGSYDLGALEAALGGASVAEGETKKDWDPEIARVIDVKGMKEVPGKGYVRKEEKK